MLGQPDRRQHLRDIALRIFAVQGYHNTKISDIVASAGVAQGTFYWHFKSKESVALEIIDDGKQRLLKVIEKGYRKNSGTVEDMVAASTRLMQALFDFSQQNRYLMALLFIKGQGADKSIRDAVSKTRTAVQEAFQRNIYRAVELGMLPDTMDVSLRTTILTSLVEGTISRWLFGPMNDLDHVPEQDAYDLAVEVAQFEFYGLLGR